MPGNASTRRYPQQLSGGQQQRVGVARALATTRPAADGRAFSAVDPVVRSSLQDDLIRLQAGLRAADRQDGLGQALMDSGADAAG